jgi:ubiquinone/menaquinone biosynthesis C-methylase UbiE/uncharacterized protein YbaR (Trm112 family)
VKHSLLASLRCPISGGELRLHAFETEDVTTENGDVHITKEGLLLSDDVRVWYPISNYVPVLLAFHTSFHERFHARHKERFSTFDEYRMPYEECEQGEAFIQQSFTEEWNLTQDNALSFLRTDEDLVNLNRHVWLRWLERERPLERVLNVGCGIGKETMALRDVTKAREVVAVDLNFALLHAASRYREVGNVHFVICSLFRLPFAKASFDLVYSQGVIHHTWSTQAAFESIAGYVRSNGYLFVWVYSLADHLMFRNSARRSSRDLAKHVASMGLFGMESMIRPWLSRSPSWLRGSVIFMLGTLFHPIFRSRVMHRNLWKPENTRHSLRDLLTPAYAFRHDVNEVAEWFEELGFRIVDMQSPSAHRKYFGGRRIHGVGLTGQKTVA